jgi:hypothetical protein
LTTRLQSSKLPRHTLEIGVRTRHTDERWLRPA